MRIRTCAPAIFSALVVVTLFSLAAPFAAASEVPDEPLTITVDRVDPPNQQPFPPFNRLYEYTDFFSRDVKVHHGDIINFQAQPFTLHIVALAANEGAARRAYPMIELDTDDAPAVGSGKPKIIFGTGNFPVTGGSQSGGGTIDRERVKGPPVCGVVQFDQPVCTFSGGSAVEIIGPTPGFDLKQRPATLDQLVRIDAPPGRYTYFDVPHPGARGTVTVVPEHQPVTTQAQVDAASAAQLVINQRQAMAVETFIDENPVSFGPPGRRTHVVVNGAGTPNNHVSIDAMLPSEPIVATAGDRITFVWADRKSFHTVGFAPSAWELPPPFGFDCGNGVYQPVPNVFNVPPPTPCLETGATVPEFIGDPGNAPSGTALRSPERIVNSGMLIGSAYGVSPIARTWTVRITARTEKGSYTFFDAVRPWASGVVVVE